MSLEYDETADAPDVSLVNGISRRDWDYWHSHPVTVALRKYFRDYTQTLVSEALDRWAQDVLVLSEEHEIKNRIKTVQEIEALTFDNLLGFYEQPKEE